MACCPGNEGRNYVLRLILRRAARFGTLLGFRRALPGRDGAGRHRRPWAHHYTELVEREAFICEVITAKKSAFWRRWTLGLARLEQIAAQTCARAARQTVPGAEAFRLYDTFGFPLELTRDAAAEMGLDSGRGWLSGRHG